MDLYATLFWVGFIMSIAVHVVDSRHNTQHVIYALIATGLMFIGSKLGREFLGIK